MISYIKGEILEIGNGFIIIENSGIGYKVVVPPQLLVTSRGTTVEVYTYHKSGDDGQTLYGMENFETLLFFEQLLSVNKVGPKLALAIISAVNIDSLKQSIASSDTGIFTRISGVGKKTGERIILELKNKMGDAIMVAGTSGSDVYDALIGLGYNPREVTDALKNIDDSLSAEKQIKAALKILARS